MIFSSLTWLTNPVTEFAYSDTYPCYSTLLWVLVASSSSHATEMRRSECHTTPTPITFTISASGTSNSSPGSRYVLTIRRFSVPHLEMAPSGFGIFLGALNLILSSAVKMYPDIFKAFRKPNSPNQFILMIRPRTVRQHLASNVVRFRLSNPYVAEKSPMMNHSFLWQLRGKTHRTEYENWDHKVIKLRICRILYCFKGIPKLL